MGTRPDNVREAMDVIGTELRRVVEEPVSGEELERAKENVKGRLVLSLESTLTRMNRLGPGCDRSRDDPVANATISNQGRALH